MVLNGFSPDGFGSISRTLTNYANGLSPGGFGSMSRIFANCA
jgi:hypothetical protein